MLHVKNLSQAQLDASKRLISELHTKSYLTYVYQVQTCIEDVDIINFDNEFDAVRFCEKLSNHDIPHSLSVLRIKYKCYE